MSIEQKINYQLNKIPGVKKVVKRVYQRTMYTLSPKIKCEGNIVRLSPDDKTSEFFFGYYDKSPWDITDRYVLCLKAKDTWSDVSPREKAEILLIDTSLPETDPKRIKKIAETSSWNVQQACMLQWLGPDFSTRIIFNDYRNGKYVSVIKEINTGRENVINAPVYSVSSDGKFALTLDFSRLYNLRPGYGYYNLEEKTKGVALPESTAIWKIDLVSGEIIPLLSYVDFANFKPRNEMKENGSIHKVNHLMISPSGKRCMVLYRWFVGQRKYTRLITFDSFDGKNMYVLSDDDMVSHCYWKDEDHILAFENKKNGGPGYYLMKDKSQEYSHCWPQLSNDGHPSYSPDGHIIVTDTYPNRARVAELKIMDGRNELNNNVKVIARVFAPFKYDNDTRCDLHPRWNHSGDKISFDSVFENHRGLYYVQLKRNKHVVSSDEELPLVSIIVPVYNVSDYLERCINSLVNQTYRNIEIILVDDGSTDDSGKKCDQLSMKDNRIVVIHKSNGGLSSARNAGLKIAKGDFVAFVDSDDWVDKDIYRKCINIAVRKECEVVDFLPIYAYDDNIKIDNSNINKSMRIVKGEDILYDYLNSGQKDKCPFSVCRKLYKRSLFNDIHFPEGRLNEDISTNFKILLNTRKLIRLPIVGYYYYQGNIDSITSGILRKKDFDLLLASRELCKLSIKCNNKKINKLARIKLSRSYFSLLAKAAIGGVDKDVNIDDIKYLTSNLRKNFGLLAFSRMPLNRKVLAFIACADYRIIGLTFKIYRKITRH